VRCEDKEREREAGEGQASIRLMKQSAILGIGSGSVDEWVVVKSPQPSHAVLVFVR
jgi:hypothetical protein